MSLPRILWNNLVSTATITSVSEDSGYPDDNIADWREQVKWQSSGANTYWIKFNNTSAKAANCFAIAGHNLYSQGVTSVVLEACDDDSTWVTLATYTPINDFTFAQFFAAATNIYYRITLTSGGGAFTPAIGVIFIGEFLEMPHLPISPIDPDAQVDVSNRSTAVSGYLLGVAQDYSQRKTEWSFRYLDPDWMIATWLPFWNAHRFKNFFWAWDVEYHSLEVYLVTFSNESLSVPYDRIWRSLNFSLIGRKEE